MSYIVMKGQLINTLETPKGVSKKGDSYGGRDQLQLLCEETLKNSEKRMVLQTLTLPEGADLKPFEKLVGKVVQLPVMPYVLGGKLGFSLGIAAGKASGAPDLATGTGANPGP